MAIDKLVVTKTGKTASSFTTEELAQREVELLAREEQDLLGLLIPSTDEIEQAEFELKTITLLQEVGLI